MLVTHAIEELENLHHTRDALVAFHGTSRTFAADIESIGWPTDRPPFDYDDLAFIMELSRRFPRVCFVENSPGLDLNFEKLRRDHAVGVSLTPQVWRASLYSRMPGGETLHYLVARCYDLLKQDSELSRKESARVTLTLKRYKRRAAFTGSVVYAVRLDDSLMEDETRSRLREIAHKQELFPHLRIHTPLVYGNPDNQKYRSRKNCG